jgi:hypothetical protein
MSLPIRGRFKQNQEKLMELAAAFFFPSEVLPLGDK